MHKVLMLISLPALMVGWVFAGMGVYLLGSSIFGYETAEENTALASIWMFMFAFGSVSVAGILAAKANYASKYHLRQVYYYSLVLTATLFLGYLIVGMGAGLLEATIGK